MSERVLYDATEQYWNVVLKGNVRVLIIDQEFVTSAKKNREF